MATQMCFACGSQVRSFDSNCGTCGIDLASGYGGSRPDLGRRIDFGEAIKLGFSNYFNFSGRATRAEFWWFYLFSLVINIIPFIGWFFVFIYNDTHHFRYRPKTARYWQERLVVSGIFSVRYFLFCSGSDVPCCIRVWGDSRGSYRLVGLICRANLAYGLAGPSGSTLRKPVWKGSQTIKMDWPWPCGWQTWTIIGIQLHVEVIYMVFAKRAYMHDVEMAEERGRVAAEKAAAEARSETRAEAQRQELMNWYEQIKDRLPEDAPPPPFLPSNGTGAKDAEDEDES